MAWCDQVGRGWLRLLADDLSAEGFGPLRWVLRNSDVVRLGALGCGTVYPGLMRLDRAWVADGSTEAQVSLLLS
jgi:hypothetical protein